MKGSRFTSFQIEGNNQNGDDVVWQPSSYSANGSQLAITAGWWWTYARFSFTMADGSTSGCIIDTIDGNDPFVLITYTAGQYGCSGGAGSAYDPYRNVVQAWINSHEEMDKTWGDTVFGQLDQANDAAECALDLSSGIFLTTACGGVAESVLSSMAQLSQTSTQPPDNSSSSTSQPQGTTQNSQSLPPGVFVTGIRLDPGNPAHNAPVIFYVTFTNTTSSTQGYRWRVYIFKADKPAKSNTETTFLQSDVPVGTAEIQSTGSFKYGAANQCDYFFTQVGWPDANNNVNFFNDPNGNVAQQGFSVCN